MLETATQEAPRKRFRGKRRYFRRVRRRVEQFRLTPAPSDSWDFWHYHADWPGWGNLGWAYRRAHLAALAGVFMKIAAVAHAFATPFQVWILLEGGDAGSDATYLHTPNPHSPFPFIAREYEWGVALPDAGVAALFGSLPLRVGRWTGVNPHLEPPRTVTSYDIYSPHVGLPVEARV